MSKYSTNEFRSRGELSIKMFHQIERSLVDYLDYVPLDFEHMNVYSLKLVTVILETGPEILASFDLNVFTEPRLFMVLEIDPYSIRQQLLDKENRLRKNKKSLTFHDYWTFLDTVSPSKPKNAVVGFRDFEAYAMPFECENPEWWESYNLLRHDKYSSLKKANLKNSLKSLAGLYWLLQNISWMIGESESSLFKVVSNTKDLRKI